MTPPPRQLRLLEDLPPVVARPGPARLSVSGLATFARCPRQCYWSVVRPLPRTASPAARVGSLIHGWIERRASGQVALLEAERPPVAGADDHRLEELRAAFVASPYGPLRPRFVERSFTLVAGGMTVRGRVDAVYERAGRLEVVDFKTGRPPAGDDGGAGVQLDLYALAAVDCFGFAPGRVRTTEWYLARGTGASRDFDEAEIARVRRGLTRRLARFSAGEFAALPGSYCGRCDFADRCPPGRAHLAGG